MVARGGTPRRLMLAAQAGDHRRNLFSKVVVRSSTRRLIPDATRLATVEEMGQTPDAVQRHGACGCTVGLKREGRLCSIGTGDSPSRFACCRIPACGAGKFETRSATRCSKVAGPASGRRTAHPTKHFERDAAA